MKKELAYLLDLLTSQINNLNEALSNERQEKLMMDSGYKHIIDLKNIQISELETIITQNSTDFKLS